MAGAFSMWGTSAEAASANPEKEAESLATATLPITVKLDETAAEVGPGEKVRFESTVRNTSDQALSGLVAHLSILSSDSDVYVDPEDWSARRTQFLDDIGPAVKPRSAGTCRR